jgi:hypothetical protein
MQTGKRAAVNDTITEISELLAKAYLRYSERRLPTPTPETLESTVPLDNAGELRPHELTLTVQRGRRRELAH